MPTPHDERDAPTTTSTERPGDVLSVDLAVRLWARARELQEEGDLAGARDVALDATVVWAIERASLDEEVLLELLYDVWGGEAVSILRSARRSSALAAWRLGSLFDQLESLDEQDVEELGEDDMIDMSVELFAARSTDPRRRPS